MQIIGTSDDFSLLPMPVLGGRSVNLVALGGFSALHAYSYLEGASLGGAVSNVSIVDVSAYRANKTSGAMRTYFAQTIAELAEYSRVNLLEQILGINITEDTQDWRGVDFSHLHARTRAHVLDISPDQSFVIIPAPEYAAASVENWRWYFKQVPPGAPSNSIGLGWGSGFLSHSLATFVGNDAPGCATNQQKLSDFLQECVIDNLNEMFVIWLSNSVDMPDRLGQLVDPDLGKMIRLADRQDNVFFWPCASSKRRFLKYAVKDYPRLWRRAKPHVYVNAQLLAHLERVPKNSPVAYVHAFEPGPDMLPELPETELLGPTSFMQAKYDKYSAVILHILSSLDDSQYMEILKKAVTQNRTTLIVEHNADSADTANRHSSGKTVGELISAINDMLPDGAKLCPMDKNPFVISWCPGMQCLRRNFVLKVTNRLIATPVA